MTDGTGVWLYAVTDDRLAEGDLGGLAGVAGESVRAVGSGGLTAVVGSVPLAVFGEEPLKRNLEDLSWLEATARAHDAVVSTVAQRGPAVPLRLATVYLDDARVRDLLDERQADFESALTLVTGRTEWGVKAYGDRQALADAVAEAQIAGSAKGSGTAYLLRRRAQLAAQESVERDAAARADEIHSRLLRQAAAGRRQPATDPALSGRRDWMVLNGTYLVDDDRADEFARAVEELGKEYPGIRLELTGPWPPYSFAGVERDTA
ncbi:GvpL/GvpF family gas vesicle protein [Rhodococcus ruber]|uniref:GvpL/GvpF family gas vesicle protein n=1 Tax=Rhodococcus TaxID=1827 RepID=UPI0007432115|nr:MULTISPECIES: GvpL/GvpF family gas vesicle protein [Rhodococcus]AUM19037.1 gas vesicle protein GvpFL [Rhodococcus ruber]AWH01406.1 gas vesicle protein GvpFL [Rhodococcus ruber]MCF8784870.1 GvpL/GvpF family gas vesicle protein [Rhodococcus ruber]